MRLMSKLGILAGAGELPSVLMQACREQGWGFHVIALRGQTDPARVGAGLRFRDGRSGLACHSERREESAINSDAKLLTAFGIQLTTDG